MIWVAVVVSHLLVAWYFWAIGRNRGYAEFRARIERHLDLWDLDCVAFHSLKLGRVGLVPKHWRDLNQ